MKKISHRLQPNHKQQGIGLLELMLALAIIAILLVMATRYYMSASLQSRINQAADALNSLPAAGECWVSHSGDGADGTYLGVGTHLYNISYNDKCYPMSLVTGSGDTAKLVLPYGPVAVTSTATTICATSIKPGTTEEANTLIQKLCKGQTVTLSAGSSTISYEAVSQQCYANTTCSAPTPSPTE